MSNAVAVPLWAGRTSSTAEPIVVTLMGHPRGKGSQRYRVIQPKDGKPPFATGYMDAETKEYMDDLHNAAIMTMGAGLPLDGPLDVRVIAFMGIPASWSGKKCSLALAGSIRPTTKPDSDNLHKSLDALTGAVWRDDAIIVHSEVDKVYSDQPRLRIEIRCWEPPLLV